MKPVAHAGFSVIGHAQGPDVRGNGAGLPWTPMKTVPVVGEWPIEVADRQPRRKATRVIVIALGINKGGSVGIISVISQVSVDETRILAKHIQVCAAGSVDDLKGAHKGEI